MAKLLICVGVFCCLLIALSKGDSFPRTENDSIVFDDEVAEPDCPRCQCGVAPRMEITSRMIGGEDAKKDEFPTFVLLATVFGKPHCGSSLVSDKFSVTAAHCMQTPLPGGRGQLNDAKSYMVIFSQHSRRDTSPLYSLKVAEFIVHENYNNVNYRNDIGLIKFAGRVTFSNSLYPICLPFAKFQTDNLIGTAIGWGQNTKGAYKASETLKKLNIPIFPNDFCTTTFKKYQSQEMNWFDPNTMLCAANSTSTVCHGDSGGPVLLNWHGRTVLAGIMSLSRCDATRIPDTFTRVSAFGTWITSKLSSDTCQCKL